ncbi:MAG: beta-N-acetylhexosaminidase [Lachnospiraceae bacterium]|nr:beta-N-acetylhexosaminidase [Lachnospiraceae bacterium]
MSEDRNNPNFMLDEDGVQELNFESENDDDQARKLRRKKKRKQRTKAVIGLLVALLLIGGGVTAALYYAGKIGAYQARENREKEEKKEVVDKILNEEPLTEVDIDPDSLLGTPGQDVAPEPTQDPEEARLKEDIRSYIDSMSLEDKVAGLFIVTPEELCNYNTVVKAGDKTRESLETYAVGGLIYFKKNIKNAEQLSQMIEETKGMSRYPLFCAIDEEGGSVSRMAEAKLFEKTPGAREIFTAGDVNAAYTYGNTIGEELSSLGFNMCLGPVCDISADEGAYMYSRTFGDTAETVSEYSANMFKGIRDKNVIPCLKHFPGMGSIKADLHKEIGVCDNDISTFENSDFVPFKRCIDEGANVIMISHMAAPKLTGEDNMPCTLSKKVVTDVLRDELGYEGVIITDAMNMDVIAQYYDADEAAVRALKAGCDMILMPENFRTAFAGVINAVNEGVIDIDRIDHSLERIYRLKLTSGGFMQ